MTAVTGVLHAELRPRLTRPRLVLMLDIDGTLAPLQPRPEDAFVPEATRQAVSALVAMPNVHVALVTGRAAVDGRRLAAVANTWVIGNHGIEAIDPTGQAVVDEEAASYRTFIEAAVSDLTARLASVAGVRVENKVWTLSVHYRQADPSVEPFVRQAMDDAGQRHGLRLIRGKKIFELRPPIHVHKGTAAVKLCRELIGPALDASLFYAGDDRTDEDAFRALRSAAPHAVTIRVGAAADDQTAATAAEFTVPDEEAIRSLLEWLATVRR